MTSSYTDATRKWAIDTYRESRDQYRSRADACAAIAETIGAHVNTVTRWINAEFGRPRVVSEEDMPEHVRALEAEIARLRQANRMLVEQIGGH